MAAALPPEYLGIDVREHSIVEAAYRCRITAANPVAPSVPAVQAAPMRPCIRDERPWR